MTDSQALQLRDWNPPPELAANRPPRPVQFKPRGWVMFVAAGLLVATLGAVALFVAREFYGESLTDDLLRTEGIEAHATITSKAESHLRHDVNHYHLRYAYVVNARRYETTGEVGWDTYRKARVGSEIHFQYAASRPEISRLGDERRPPWWLYILWFGPSIIIVPLLLLKPLSLFRDRTILAWGNVACGFVTSTNRLNGSGFNKGSKVQFEFLDHNGELVKGSATTGETPEPGAPITVLY